MTTSFRLIIFFKREFRGVFGPTRCFYPQDVPSSLRIVFPYKGRCFRTLKYVVYDWTTITSKPPRPRLIPVLQFKISYGVYVFYRILHFGRLRLIFVTTRANIGAVARINSLYSHDAVLTRLFILYIYFFFIVNNMICTVILALVYK